MMTLFRPRSAFAAVALGALLFSAAPAQARDGALAVERWTYLRTYQDGAKTRHEFHKESFALRPDGTATLAGDQGTWTYSVGGTEDDTLAVQRRQAVNGRFVMVEWEFDTDPDKARFNKAGAVKQTRQRFRPRLVGSGGGRPRRGKPPQYRGLMECPCCHRARPSQQCPWVRRRARELASHGLRPPRLHRPSEFCLARRRLRAAQYTDLRARSRPPCAPPVSRLIPPASSPLAAWTSPSLAFRP